MSDMTYWCESCARKNNCYTIGSRPKCFTPITSNDRTADHKTEPQKICKYCGGKCDWWVDGDCMNGDCHLNPKTEPQTDCSWQKGE